MVIVVDVVERVVEVRVDEVCVLVEVDVVVVVRVVVSEGSVVVVVVVFVVTVVVIARHDGNVPVKDPFAPHVNVVAELPS